MNPFSHTKIDGYELGVIKTHPPCPSDVYPDAQDVKSVSIGKHPPAPSLVYPEGQTEATETESGRHEPFPLL